MFNDFGVLALGDEFPQVLNQSAQVLVHLVEEAEEGFYVVLQGSHFPLHLHDFRAFGLESLQFFLQMLDLSVLFADVITTLLHVHS